MKASTIQGKANVEALERDARALLCVPALPDGANGPRGQAILAEIQADEKVLGKAATLRKWAHVSTVAYATSLDDDPEEHKAASKRMVKDLEHPTKKGEYAFPSSARLDAALANPAARAKCSAQALARLEAHKASEKEISDEDWKPKDA